MDNKSKDDINKPYYSPGGMAVLTILGIIGFLMLYFSRIYEVRSIDMLYDCLAKVGINIIFGGFFFAVSMYCWILFIQDTIIKPKEEVLVYYLDSRGDKHFFNKKGKKFNYYEKNFHVGTHYKVLKTRNNIWKVLGESEETWEVEERRSYWLNWYSPFGTFEDIFLLPIVYVMAIPGVLSAIMTKGLMRIPGLIISAIPLYLIAYDYIYKIKQNKSGNKKIDDTKLKEFNEAFTGILGKAVFLRERNFIYMYHYIFIYNNSWMEDEITTNTIFPLHAFRRYI